jgi:ParB family chromosome partitioning protein
VLQPLVVTSDGNGRFAIIAGERRWRAAKAAGLTQVPVLIREVADDQELLELALVENLQRADLDVIEEAEAYNLLAERFGLSQEAIGKRVGKSRPAVANALRLLRLPPAIRDMLRDGRLTAGQARPLLAIGDAGRQVALAEQAVAEGLTARALEKLATQERPKQKAKIAPPEPDVHTRVAMERLTQSLQTHVEIRRRRRGGEILIKFHTEDELIRLFDHLTEAKGDP